MNDRQRPRHLHKTMVDYVAIAIAPALIMLLIGSLVFFLVDAFYSGDFVFSLKFIFTMYVIATVLIGRIAIEEGKEHAMLYAIPLAIVSMMAVGMFAKVTGPLAGFSFYINGCLLASIWFSAHQLTWDCTLIDDQQDASGQGLLEAAGLDQSRQDQAEPADPSEEIAGTTSREEPERTWWEWYKQRQRRPHSPGLWVIYFSIVALALFGSVSMFVPETKQAQSFQYLVVFVASALALLMSTSFLGLRRYLRQRQVEMEADMATAWLTAGTILIVVLLVFCALLPRPGGMTLSAKDLPISWSGPKSPQTSKFGFGPEGVKAKQPGGSASKRSKQQGGKGEDRPKPRHVLSSPIQHDNQSRNKSKQHDNRSNNFNAKSKQAKNQAGSKNPSNPKQSAGKYGAKKGSKKSSTQASKQSSQQSSKQDTKKRQSNSKKQDLHQGIDLTGESPPRQRMKKSKQAGQKQSGKNEASQKQSDNSRQPKGGGKQNDNSKQNDKKQNDSKKKDAKKDDREEEDGKKKAKSKNEDNGQAKDGKKDQQSNKQRGSRAGGSGTSKSKSEKDDSKKQDDSNKQDNEKQRASGGGKGSQSKKESKRSSSASTPPKSTPRKSWNWPKFSFSKGLMLILKLAFYGLLIGVTIFLVWKYRRELQQAWISFLDELRRLWERLFGGGDGSGSSDEGEEGVSQVGKPPAPFASFSNPFSSRSGMQSSAVVHYTFEAFIAWAREHGCSKDRDDTPLEFAQLVASTHQPISGGSRTLAEIYCRLAYDSQYTPSPQDVEQLRGLWNQMQQS